HGAHSGAPLFLGATRLPRGRKADQCLEAVGESGAPPNAYSYFSVSTGSSREARFAGTVPKMTPTITEVASAITAACHGTGSLYGVRSRTEMGIPMPMMVPTSPPESDMNTDSVRNWSRISRRVAPRA